MATIGTYKGTAIQSGTDAQIQQQIQQIDAQAAQTVQGGGKISTPISTQETQRLQALPTTFAPPAPTTPATSPTPVAQPSTTGGFAKQLDLGVRDPSVKALQQFLNSIGFKVAGSGPGSPGQETDFFGPLTQEAVRKFQLAQGIIGKESVGTAGFGRVGPQTLATLNRLAQEKGFTPVGGGISTADVGGTGTFAPGGTPALDTANLGAGVTAADLQGALGNNQKLQQLIAQSLLPSQTEQDLQKQLVDFQSKFKESILGIQKQAIPTPFIVGQEREQTQLFQAQEANITAQLELAQQSREQVLEATKTLSTLQRQNFADMLEVAQGVDPNKLPLEAQQALTQMAKSQGIPPALLFAGLKATADEAAAKKSPLSDDFNRARQFITDNPNATFEELSLGLRENTKLTDTNINLLLESSDITKQEITLSPSQVQAIATALVRQSAGFIFGRRGDAEEAKQFILTNRIIPITSDGKTKEITLTKQQVDQIIAEIDRLFPSGRRTFLQSILPGGR